MTFGLNKSTENLQLNELNKNGEMKVTGKWARALQSAATRVCVEAGGLQRNRTRVTVLLTQ